MDNKNKEKIKCIFYMKSGFQIERRINFDTFNGFLILIKTNKDGLLELFDEIQESTILIRIKEIEYLQYWE